MLNDHPIASFAQDNRILNRYGAKLFSAQNGPTFRATAAPAKVQHSNGNKGLREKAPVGSIAASPDASRQ